MYHGSSKERRTGVQVTGSVNRAPDATWMNVVTIEPNSTSSNQTVKMKPVKFNVHTSGMKRIQGPSSEESKETEDLLINPIDFPELKDGDIVEIYHVEDEFSRLLLQVKSGSLKEEHPRHSVSVEDSIAKTFQLRQYGNVIVNQVSFRDVELNHVELCFKDQYFSRSDMWRYRNSLVGTCAYLHKKMEFGCGRTTIHEMWSKGTRVACGTIGENTKIVYRSMTANVYIFIQMSVEMWEFDHYGDLYFEKSVKGFLTDLFKRWQKQQANHDVTIVMFSRTFYEAKSLDEFPCSMREGLLEDYKGRFYEDFYRIVIQNEKYDDWTLTLIKLKTIFHSYKNTVLNFHARPGVKLPRAYNSTAAEGNVLEVLNMSLNVFEKHTVDRNFERTGQMCVVITPSTGVFEVDRELLNLTKQKSIDYGIGNDLVFMGEQPLHVVPLFILHNKRRRSWNKPGEEPADYAIPNWLNYSYYTSKDISPGVFVPRIRIPEEVLLALQNKTPLPATSKNQKEKPNVTKRPVNSTSASMWKTAQKKVRMRTGTERRVSESNVPANSDESPEAAPFSDGEDIRSHMLLSSSLETANPLRPNARAADNSNDDQLADLKRKTTKSPNVRHQRSLINPLAPSKIPVKLTSNRRRWVDIFPQDTSGAAVQTHHFRGASHSEDAPELSRSPASDTPKDSFARDTESPHSKLKRGDESDRVSSWINNTLDGDEASTIDEEMNMAESVKSPRRMRSARSTQDIGRGSPAPSSSHLWKLDPQNKEKTKKSFVWGITGEMEWTPNLTTGVDWKALTMPASLPITTDYLPDRRALQNDYLISNYSVLPEEPTYDSYTHLRVEGQDGYRYYSRPLGLRELYDELICQRLQHGFQLITGTKVIVDADMHVAGNSKLPIYGKKSTNEVTYLSLGRVIHMLTLDQSGITVKRFSPRHRFTIPRPLYKYRFMVPDNTTYEVSWVRFTHERLENFNWNYNDFCVLTKGRGEFKLEAPMKFWQCQFYLLPSHADTVKTISYPRKESAEDSENEQPLYCDIFTERTNSDYDSLCEGFMRIMEVCNRLKKTVNINRRPGSSVGGKKYSVPNRGLHRGANPAAVSTPDLPSGVISPRIDVLPQHYSNLDIVKTAVSMGLDISSPDGVNSPQTTSNLTMASPLSEILDAMKVPSEGIVYNKQADLQPGFFIAYEAVDWALENLSVYCSELVTELFQRMIVENLIVHASGNPNHPFICGFYLYNIVPSDGKHLVAAELNSADVNFDQVWIECAIINPAKSLWRTRIPSTSVEIPEFFQPEPKFEKVEFGVDKSHSYDLAEKKACVIDVDLYHKSDRLEWAVANYHSTFTPNYAYALEVKWIQASGLMFGELMQIWSRRCPSNGFHLVPVPSDPFALQQRTDADPLRMPIFVPLKVDALVDARGKEIFHEFSPESRRVRIVLLQEAILKRFGFISLQDNAKKTDVRFQSREYVCVSGGMFVMIPSEDNSREMETLRKSELEAKSETAVRHVHDSETGGCGAPTHDQIGFYWAWNSCLTKKWRSSHTGDEDFLDKMLLDFRRFCSNADGRLGHFWRNCSKPLSAAA